MNATETSRYILDTLKGVDMVDNGDAYFFFYNPDPDVPPDHQFPFATIVMSDNYDQFSDLNRPDVFRLNMGIGKQTFRARFGTPKLPSDREGATESGADESPFDFTALDQVLPHPVYGRMYWVCVLNPGAETFETDVRPLLSEAYELAVGKYDRKAARS